MSIDTLEFAKELEAAGLDRKQAEAHAAALRKAIEKEIASKQDVEGAANRVEQKLGARIHELEARFDKLIHELEVRFDKRIHDLEVKFEQLQARVQVLTWMVGFNLAATMAILWKLLR
jgi:DNA anti-recombination protein RmuC